MENFIFSNHATEQMQNRGISMEIALEILQKPEVIINQGDQVIHQSMTNFTNDTKKYLVRIFINASKNPKVIITVYRTSKIEKYNEGQI